MYKLREFNRLKKIIDNNKEIYEDVISDKEMYCFFSINALVVWYKGNEYCNITTEGIRLNDYIRELSDKQRPSSAEKLRIYLEKKDIIKDIISHNNFRDKERKSQNKIASNNNGVLFLEFKIPKEIIANTPETDIILKQGSSIYAVEYKRTYNPIFKGTANLEKHCADISEMMNIKDLIKDAAAVGLKLRGIDDDCSSCNVFPALLFTNLVSAEEPVLKTPCEIVGFNSLIEKLAQKYPATVVWSFDKDTDVDFTKEPIPIGEFRI